MTITVKNIIEWSKPHRFHREKARQTILFNEKFLVSIVGGDVGLYGDFVEDFEVAILTPDMKSFLTRFIRPEINDDVIPYMKIDEMEELLNFLFFKGFQVK